MRSGRNRGGNWKKLECQLGEIALGSGIEIKYCGQNFSELKKWLVTRRNSFEMGMEIGKIGLTTGRNLCSVNKLIFVMKQQRQEIGIGFPAVILNVKFSCKQDNDSCEKNICF